MRIFDDPIALLGAVGEDLGHSPWREVGARQVADFAAATARSPGDECRDPADPTPGDVSLLHLLSLLAGFRDDIYQVRNVEMVINYGLEHVRFTAPLQVGEPCRARATLVAGCLTGAAVRATNMIDISTSTRTVCVAASVTIYHPRSPR